LWFGGKFYLFMPVTVNVNDNFSIFTATHSLDYYFTGVTPGIKTPEFTAVGCVDGLQGGFYDSNVKEVVLTADWIKDDDDVEHWTLQELEAQSFEDLYKFELPHLMKLFNQTGGIHTWQRKFGCELHDDGSITGYSQYAYDGEDFIRLDLNTVSWIAANDKAVIIKQEWDQTPTAFNQKNFLENDCILCTKKYVDVGKATLEGKEQSVSQKADPLPSHSVFLYQRDSSEVVCHATGFFPKALMISWQKNGEDLHEDVDLRETLPNLDDTFQKKSILTVSPEELDKHNYTCIVQHISLEKEMVLQVNNHRAAVTVLLVVVVIFVWKKKQPGKRRNASNFNMLKLSSDC
uniref:Ig-like domain-containing protein n=1 Tax=Pygocentrus nattereri TaxID=42514 RepID=A0A3B4D5E2_PYGNA